MDDHARRRGVACALEDADPQLVEQWRDPDGSDRATQELLAAAEAKLARGERQQTAIPIIDAPRPSDEPIVGAFQGAGEGRQHRRVHARQFVLQRSLKLEFAVGRSDVHRRNASLRCVPGLLTPMRALLLGSLGLVLQVVALLPPVVEASESIAAMHYLQHGIIFAGGVCMGIALRDLLMMSRRR